MSALAQVEIVNIAVLAVVICRVLGIQRIIDALSREVTPPPAASHGLTLRPAGSRGAGPSLRASHADRDLAADILRVAAGDGRLTTAELEERLETALTARTVTELAALTADLPAGPVPSPVQVAVADTADRAASRWALLRSLSHQA